MKTLTYGNVIFNFHELFRHAFLGSFMASPDGVAVVVSFL